MPYSITKFQPTPNPNALKCILDRPLPAPIRSFRTREQAAGDPLGEAMFSVPGVTGLLLSGDWLTVNKAEAADWGTIKKNVADVLLKS